MLLLLLFFLFGWLVGWYALKSGVDWLVGRSIWPVWFCFSVSSVDQTKSAKIVIAYAVQCRQHGHRFRCCRRFRRHRHHHHQHHAKKNRIFIHRIHSIFAAHSILLSSLCIYTIAISIKKVFFLWPFLCSYYKFVCVHIALMSRGKVHSAPKILFVCLCVSVCVLLNITVHVHSSIHIYTYTSVSRWERNNLILFEFLLQLLLLVFGIGFCVLVLQGLKYVPYAYDPIASRLFVNQIFYE